MSEPKNLPMHPTSEDPAAAEAGSACGAKVYVTNEEAAVVRALKRLHDRAVGIREVLQGTDDGAERERLETELANLRREREALSVRREAAYRRKMVMLGHMPPSALLEEP
jgi:hypothetical protein